MILTNPRYAGIELNSSLLLLYFLALFVHRYRYVVELDKVIRNVKVNTLVDKGHYICFASE